MKKIYSLQIIRSFGVNLFKTGQDRSQIVKRNAAYGLIVKIIAMIIEFVKVPVILTYLDNETYGIWLTIVSIVLWTHQFDMGLSSGLTYRVTESIALKKKQHVRELVSTAYISMATIMLFVFIIATPIIKNLNWTNILNTTHIPNNELVCSIILVLSVFVFQFVFELICSILRADQKAAAADAFKPVANFLSLGFILLLGTFSSNSLLWACIAMTVPYLLLLATASFFMFNGRYKEYSPNIKFFQKSCIKDIYSLGLKFFVGQLAALIVYSTASILLSHLVNPTETAIYNTARTYFLLISAFNAIALRPFSAAITDAYVKNELIWVKKSMKYMLYLGLLFTIISIIMFLVYPYAIKIWTHDRIVVPMALAVLLAIDAILTVFSEPYITFLGGVGKVSFRMILGITKIVLFIPVAVILIKMWGAVGLSLSIIIINLVPNIIFGVLQYHLIINGKAQGIWNK